MYQSFAVSICICEMLFSTYTDHISIMSPVSETQDYDYLYHIKGAVKFGASEMIYVELRAKKLLNVRVSFDVNGCICELLFITNIEHTSIISAELMKLRIMTISIKTKVLIKF